MKEGFHDMYTHKSIVEKEFPTHFTQHNTVITHMVYPRATTLLNESLYICYELQTLADKNRANKFILSRFDDVKTS